MDAISNAMKPVILVGVDKTTLNFVLNINNVEARIPHLPHAKMLNLALLELEIVYVVKMINLK